VIVFQTFYQIETKQISCEFIQIFDYRHKTAVKECHMFYTTSIESPNITMFTRDNSMETLAMEHNKKIFYLPNKIGDAYPNLIILRAANCSIKEISRQNFKIMTELKEMHLNLNQIEKIATGAFKDLKKLELINLCYNQIKEIENGGFRGLTKLKVLYLQFNQIEKIANDAFKDLTMLELLTLGKKINLKYLN
jgi:leucine-rich repeat and immunoglobulin-like domain-containing nogo receptor-interacting protein